jgi:hypothetical protein
MMIGIAIATCLLALVVAMSLNTAHIPGPVDSAMALESSITKSATYAGTVYDNGAGFAPGGVGLPMAAVVDISSIEIDSGNETYAFVLTECATSGGSYTACGPTVTLTASGSTAVAGLLTVPGFVTQRYVKLSLTIGGTIATGVTYSANLIPIGRPG